MDTDLVPWLETQLYERGWSQRELARRSGVSHASISSVLSYQRRATWDFCAAVARALHVPADDVFVMAGLKRKPPAEVAEETEALTLFRTLPAVVRQVVMAMLRALGGQDRAQSRAGEGKVVYEFEDHPLLYEMVEEFRQVPDQWKEEAVAQMAVFRRLATQPRARVIGEEERAGEGKRDEPGA